MDKVKKAEGHHSACHSLFPGAYWFELWLIGTMATATSQERQREFVTQFSVFTDNRLGRLHELIGLLSSRTVHILALTVLDTTDSAIIRIVVDDPDMARSLLLDHGFAFTQSRLLVVELDSATNLSSLMAALLQADINVHYLYSFIPHPGGKSLIALSIEDSELAEQALRQQNFRVLRQADISR